MQGAATISDTRFALALVRDVSSLRSTGGTAALRSMTKDAVSKPAAAPRRAARPERGGRPRAGLVGVDDGVDARRHAGEHNEAGGVGPAAGILGAALAHRAGGRDGVRARPIGRSTGASTPAEPLCERAAGEQHARCPPASETAPHSPSALLARPHPRTGVMTSEGACGHGHRAHAVAHAASARLTVAAEPASSKIRSATYSASSLTQPSRAEPRECIQGRPRK